MKILVSITTALIIAVTGTSGFFIWHLQRQITDLEASSIKSLQEMSVEINESLDETDTLVLKQLDDLSASMDDYSISLQAQADTKRETISNISSQAENLKDSTSLTESILDRCAPQNYAVYEKVRKATVRISYQGYYLGTGFIVSFPDKWGTPVEHIVTAYELVDFLVSYSFHPAADVDARTFEVTLSDGRTHRGNIHSCSREMNIAILRFMPINYDKPYSIRDFQPLDSLPLGDSSTVCAGDYVYVIGSPDDGETRRAGLKESLTTGIVSQVGRCYSTGDYFRTGMIQIDSAINFGNLGSPLVNSKGEVIGLITARINPLIGEGIGFAVTSNTIRKVGDLTKGFKERVIYGNPHFTYSSPDTGLTVENLLPKDIVKSNNEIISGAKVTEVSISSNVQIGDVIIGIDDHPVYNSNDFYSCIEE
ncbi:MAG: trypsin-like serine protease, partial [Dehalococcoidales bacterium]|nr:trypsin-like serine protease [Dehalococcoidales bacterium]